jgi:hypothetical protein
MRIDFVEMWKIHNPILFGTSSIIFTIVAICFLICAQGC